MENVTIVGLRLDHRVNSAPQVQEVLTRHGDSIIGRFGIPDPIKEDGLITLYMKASSNDIEEFSNEVSAIEGVTVKTINI